MSHDPAASESLYERTVPGLHEHLCERLSAVDRRAPVLDIGCGTGAWLARLARAGFADMHGVDRGPAPPEHLGIRFAQVDVERQQLPFAASSFGLITAIEVLEHVLNTGVFLGELRRLVRPDGVILLTTPNVHSVAARLRFLLSGELPFFDRKGDPTHVSPVFVPLLERALPAHGLRLESTWTYPPAPRQFRFELRALARAARVALADPLAGDSLCLLLRASA